MHPQMVLRRRLDLSAESVKPVVIALGLLVCLISPVLAQSDPIQQDLASVLKALSEQITRADQLVAPLA